MSAHRQGCKWHGHELRHEVSSSVCGCDDQLMQHKPECPASWGVGEMPEGPCTFCELLSACEQRIRNQDIATHHADLKEAKALLASRDEAWVAGVMAAREAVEALRGCLGTDDNGDGTVWVEKADALDAIEGLREKP